MKWSDPAVSVEEPLNKDHFEISIYPNPTRGVSSFEFRVPCSGNVTIKIYDLQGREVATVVDDVMPAGEHVVRFDVSALPAGVYIWRTSVESTCHPDPPSGGEGSAGGKLIKY